ncbi:MAG: type IV secretory system conjugative DNA transfer family protein [Solirubrobacteraceae bacterium]
MTDRPPGGPGSGPLRRWASLALLGAILLAPSVWVAVGLIAAALATAAAPALLAGFRRGPLARALEAARHGPALVLGTGPQGRPVGLGDSQLAAHGLVVGASGAGKTTTLLTMLDAQIRLGRPVIAIDMKGSPAFAAALGDSASAAGRGLRIFTPDGSGHWNPLAHGNATSLKDMLIGSERFTEPHYKRAAERYLQTALGVLLAAHPDRQVQLHEVVAAMEPRRLSAMLRGLPSPQAASVQDYLASMTHDQVSAVRGLGTRLAVLSESCAGPYLRTDTARPATEIDLAAGLNGGDVILLSLNSSVYGQLAAQLGALAIQDLVSATGRRMALTGAQPATIAIDEFSALGGDNVLALIARGREPGISVVLATQEMADLDRAGHGFRDQVLGIVGVKIIHRQDVPASAELIAQMAGTEAAWDVTRTTGGGASRSTRRQVERYVVHPNEIKTLEPGQAVVLTKLPRAEVQRVRVRPAPHRGLGGPARDDDALGR